MTDKIKVVILKDDSYASAVLFLQPVAETTDAELDAKLQSIITNAKPPKAHAFVANLTKIGLGSIPCSNIVTMEYVVSSNHTGAAKQLAREVLKDPFFKRAQHADSWTVALAMLNNEDWKGLQTIDLMESRPFLTIDPTGEPCPTN